MILSARKIADHLNGGSIAIEPFNELDLKPASYTLHLGSIVNDIENGSLAVETIPHSEEGFRLLPGHFVVATSLERVSLGKGVAAFLSVRGGCSRKGIDALGSDLFVEPGWDGHLSFTISNLGQSVIVLNPGMAIVKCVFMPIEE